MAPRKLSDTDKRDVIELYKEPNETTSTIAERYGVSNSTISRILKNLIPEDVYSHLISQKRQGSAVERSSEPMATLSPLVTPEETPQKPIARLRKRVTLGTETEVTDTNPESTDAPEREVGRPEPTRFPINLTQANPTRLSPIGASVAAGQPPAAPFASESTAPNLGSRPEKVRPAPPRRRAQEPADLSPQQTQLPLLEEVSVVKSVLPNLAVDRSAPTIDFDDLAKVDSPLIELEDDDYIDIDDDIDDDIDADFDDDDAFEGEEDDELDDDDYLQPHLTDAVNIMPLSQAVLPRTCYLVIDRLSELITRPLSDFADLGQIPTAAETARTLPVFDNHRVARRFSRRNQRVIKVPNGQLLTKTSPYLQAKGIAHLLIDGHIYSLMGED